MDLVDKIGRYVLWGTICGIIAVPILFIVKVVFSLSLIKTILLYILSTLVTTLMIVRLTN